MPRQRSRGPPSLAHATPYNHPPRLVQLALIRVPTDVDPFIVPTVGFSEPIHKELGDFNVTFYDLGGGSRIRGVWPQYFADVHGIIYVVDAVDSARLEEAAKELHAAQQHPMVIGKPTLM